MCSCENPGSCVICLLKRAEDAEKELEGWRVYHTDDEPSWRHAAEAREMELAGALRRAEEAETRSKVLEKACIQQDHEIQQILGKALGYPKYSDDHKNFPEATEADGVCTGDHVAESIAAEAAGRIVYLRQRVEEAEKERDSLAQTSGDLCEVCGWRGIRASEPCAFCRISSLEAEVETWKRLAESVQATNSYCQNLEAELRDSTAFLREELEREQAQHAGLQSGYRALEAEVEKLREDAQLSRIGTQVAEQEARRLREENSELRYQAEQGYPSIQQVGEEGLRQSLSECREAYDLLQGDIAFNSTRHEQELDRLRALSAEIVKELEAMKAPHNPPGGPSAVWWLNGYQSAIVECLSAVKRIVGEREGK